MTTTNESFTASGRGTLGVLRLPRTVLFGAGQRHAVADAVAGLGRSALVCTDPRMAASPELAEMVQEIKSAGVQVHVFGDTQPELPVEGVSRVRPGPCWA